MSPTSVIAALVADGVIIGIPRLCATAAPWNVTLDDTSPMIAVTPLSASLVTAIAPSLILPAVSTSWSRACLRFDRMLN